MSWRGWDGKRYTVEQFKVLVATMPVLPQVRQITLHNTGAPNLAQTKRGARTIAEMQPIFNARMRSFENYYKNEKRWDAGPNLFVFEDGTIGVGTPLNKLPVHSAGFNGRSLALEMCADFALGHDDDDLGAGLVVKDTAAKAFAILMRHYGFDPAYKKTWFLHKNDPKTTHDCPGNDIEPLEFQARLQRYHDDLGEAGDHGDGPPIKLDDEVDGSHTGTFPPPPRPGWANVLEGDTLNVRDSSGMAGLVVEKLAKDTKVEILSEAKNAATTWLNIKTPSGVIGWVSGKFIRLDTGLPVVMDHNDVSMAVLTGLPVKGTMWTDQTFMVKGKEWKPRPYTLTQAAAFTGQFMRESWPRMETRAMGDQSTAWGIGQWRLERQAAMRSFAKNVMGQEADDLISQLLFAMYEMDTTEKVWGDLLRKATNMEEAVSAAIAFEKPKGWLRPKNKDGSTKTDWPSVIASGKKGDGYLERTNFATQMIREYPDIKVKALAGKVN